MLPVIAIVGRPNVGKSTLFNKLTKSRAALVIDQPGVTRDRQFGEAVWKDRPYLLVDTGGIIEGENSDVTRLMEKQVDQAIADATIVLFMVDVKAGLTAADEMIGEQLRTQSKKVIVVANKADHEDADIAASEFHRLGLGKPYVIAATRRRGLSELMADVFEKIPATETSEEDLPDAGIKIAVVGRPNVGKSTLINRMLGEERVIVFDQPGTTRDSIYIPFEREGEKFTLIDTAGVRRRGKRGDIVEKFSIIKTMQAINASNVVIMIIDARDSISEQDLRLLGLILAAGKAIVIAINKWDDMDEYDREQVKKTIDRRMPFVEFARRYFISALHGTGVGKLYRAINEAYASATREISTPEITKALESAVKTHEPPLVKGRRVRLRYAHLGSQDPLVIVIHGKQTKALPESYQKYLSNYFRKYFKLVGIPVLIKFKTDENPYS